MILTKFHGVATNNVGWFMLPFAAGNFLGPLLLGRYFDHWGRRVMIARWLGVAAEGKSLEALAAGHHHDDAGAE